MHRQGQDFLGQLERTDFGSAQGLTIVHLLVYRGVGWVWAVYRGVGSRVWAVYRGVGWARAWALAGLTLPGVDNRVREQIKSLQQVPFTPLFRFCFFFDPAPNSSSAVFFL